MKYLPNCFGNRFQALTDTSLSLNVQASFQDIVCLVPDYHNKASRMKFLTSPVHLTVLFTLQSIRCTTALGLK